MAKRKTPNHYQDTSLAQMTHVVGAIKRGTFETPEWATERKFAVMEVTERLMEISDKSDSMLQFSIRGWIGAIQEIEGL